MSELKFKSLLNALNLFPIVPCRKPVLIRCIWAVCQDMLRILINFLLNILPARTTLTTIQIQSVWNNLEASPKVLHITAFYPYLLNLIA